MAVWEEPAICREAQARKRASCEAPCAQGGARWRKVAQGSAKWGKVGLGGTGARKTCRAKCAQDLRFILFLNKHNNINEIINLTIDSSDCQ